jgi:thiamine monophosphate kinase
VVEGERIPLSQPLRNLWGEGALLRAVIAGDDYQIAFTGPAGLNGPFTCIGYVEAGSGVALMHGGAEVTIPKPGYRHF